jgi:hypothetical protein
VTHERADGPMLPAFDWNGGRLQLESLAGIVGIRTGSISAEAISPICISACFEGIETAPPE